MDPRQRRDPGHGLAACLCALLALAVLLAGCRGPRKGPESLPRPASGYLHWLARDSMLNQAQALIAEVSQSSRVWLQAAEPGRAGVLARAAPNWWLAAAPEAESPAFPGLEAQLDALRQAGFGALYLGDAAERPGLLADPASGAQTGASLLFAARLGGDAAYASLRERAEGLGLQIGSTLLGAATGQGADFLLQARNAPGYAGLYAMLPAPVDAPLPPAKAEWDCARLDAAALARLDDLVPARLARDEAAWASPSGWAVTGAVTGVDGQPRRWLYRYSQDETRPVLAWQDPSGLAPRTLSAGVIRLTGLLGQALTGICMEPLFGLEPGGSGQSLSPGLEAVNELARQMHRYGGWALQADPAPAWVIERILAGPCDFCRDDYTPLLVAFGLLAADGRPVAALYRRWIELGLDATRLARGVGGERLLPRLLDGDPQTQAAHASLAQAGSPLSWSAIGARTGMGQERALRFALAWRLGLPGLCFIGNAEGSPDLAPWLASSLRARASSGLALGALQGVARGGGGGLALATRLPNGNYWLLLCNFGVHQDQISVRLPQAFASAMDVASGESLGAGLNGKVFRMALDGREARNVLLQQADTR